MKIQAVPANRDQFLRASRGCSTVPMATLAWRDGVTVLPRPDLVSAIEALTPGHPATVQLIDVALS